MLKNLQTILQKSFRTLVANIQASPLTLVTTNPKWTSNEEQFLGNYTYVNQLLI